MADTPARMRQIVGTTADWGAHDLVLGAGELAIERLDAATVRAKIGDGTKPFSQSPYLQGPLDLAAADARYVQESETFTTGGPPAANKWPKLGAGGVLDASLVNLPAALHYKGATDPTQPPPAGAIAGDLYIALNAGVINAGWGALAGGQTARAGDWLVLNNSGLWQLVPMAISNVTEAPSNGITYGRLNGAWSATHYAGGPIVMGGQTINSGVPTGSLVICGGSVPVTDGATIALRGQTSAFSPGAIEFITGGSTRMQLNPSGELGIDFYPAAGVTSKLQIAGDVSLFGIVPTLMFNAYYAAGWFAQTAGYSAGIKCDTTTGQLQFMTSASSVAAGAASDIRLVGSFDHNGLFYSIGGITSSGDIHGNNAVFCGTSGNFYLYNGPAGAPDGSPLLVFDTNDFLQYDRAGNAFNFVIGGGNVPFQVKMSGNLSTVAMFIQDTDYFLNLPTGDTPGINFAPNDFFRFIRSQNRYQMIVAQAEIFGAAPGRADFSGDLQVAQSIYVGGDATGLGIGGGLTAQARGGTALHTWTQTANYNAGGWNHLGNEVGSINVTASGTTYNTISDARLKANIGDCASDAGALIDAIRVRQFDWKDDGAHVRFGTVAQELREICPESVAELIATEADGEDGPMLGVDYSTLVPLLIREIQALRARVGVLERPAEEVKP